MKKYYVPITQGISVENLSDAFLQMKMRSRGVPIPKEILLHISCPENDTYHSRTIMESFFVNGIYFDNSPSTPYKKAVLGLRGGIVYENILHAMLEVDVADPRRGKSIMLSPLPFGSNGKPQLPFNMEDKLKFRILAEFFLCADKETLWTATNFADAVVFNEGVSNSLGGFNSGAALYWIKEFVKIGLAERRDDNKGWISIMNGKEFKKIFGLDIHDVSDFQ